MFEIKNTLEGVKSRIYWANKILVNSKTQQKNLQKKRKRAAGSCGTSNSLIYEETESLKVRSGREGQIFEVIAPNFPNVIKTINPQLKEVRQSPNVRNTHKKNYTKVYHSHITQTSYKKILKANREKKTPQNVHRDKDKISCQKQ